LRSIPQEIQTPEPRKGKAQELSAAKVQEKSPKVPKHLEGLKAFVVNLDRRPDRWARCEGMLKKETPWLEYERFSASDGSKMTIPRSEVCSFWLTNRNAVYACDYDEWVYDAPGTDFDGAPWRFPKDEPDDNDKEWSFERGEDGSTGVLTKKATRKTWNMKLVFAERYRNPGQVMLMSGGERGCAHSHRRIWEVAARREAPTLVLEDDVQFCFERSDPALGRFNGDLFTKRLQLAMKEAPADFDVLYLGWAGWRGGNFYVWKKQDKGKAIRRAEYVYTTVAYVISQKAAQQLLSLACPLDQPVDNFMAWEASQGRLKSFVIVDEGDSDDLWAGGIVDQHDFVGDSDVKKSDGAAAKIFTVDAVDAD
jgi:GR25 family glycosyltransferase involved in LPS biosynthesis